MVLHISISEKNAWNFRRKFKIYLIFNNFFYLDEIFLLTKNQVLNSGWKSFTKLAFRGSVSLHSFAYATERMPVWRHASATTIQRRFKKNAQQYIATIGQNS